MDRTMNIKGRIDVNARDHDVIADAVHASNHDVADTSTDVLPKPYYLSSTEILPDPQPYYLIYGAHLLAKCIHADLKYSSLTHRVNN